MKKILFIGAATALAAAGLAGCSKEEAEEVVEIDIVQSEGEQDTQSGVEEVMEASEFVKDNDLEGAYILEAVVEGGNIDLLFDDDVTLIIDEYGVISGEACNTFVSSVSEDGETSQAASTRMYCEEPEGIMDLENFVIDSFGGELETTGSGFILKGKTNTDWMKLDTVELD